MFAIPDLGEPNYIWLQEMFSKENCKNIEQNGTNEVDKPSCQEIL